MKTFGEFLNEAKSTSYQNIATDFLKLLKSYGGSKKSEIKSPHGRRTVYELKGQTTDKKDFVLTITRDPFVAGDVHTKFVYFISELSLEGEKLSTGHKEYFKEDSGLLRKFEIFFKTLKNVSSKDLTKTTKYFIVHNTTELE